MPAIRRRHSTSNAVLTVRSVDHAEWLAHRDAWDALLSASAMNPMFLSLDWQRLWWQHADPRKDETLVVLLAYHAGELVGAAPFILGPATRRWDVFGRSAQLVGHLLNQDRGMFSEYQDVIARADMAKAVRRAFLRELLANHGCTEISLFLSMAADQWREASQEEAHSHFREPSRHLSYQADLSDGFTTYLAKLSGSTRRSVFNLRKRLAQHGEVAYLEMPPDQHLTALDELQALHAIRWGKAPFAGRTLAFHRDLMRCWEKTGQVVMSKLLVGDRCVSAQYDIRIGQQQFNLQQGFDPNFDPQLSLGRLHLGYAMEAAAATGVHRYDFLYGNGKTTNYKEQLATGTQPVASVHIIRGWCRRSTYQQLDQLRRLKRRLSRPG